MRKEVSVIVCAYNEERSIQQAVEGVMTALDGFVDDYEILIVNDGSQDQTSQIAEELCRKYSKVKIIHHVVNQGYGCALKSGLKQATKEYVSNFSGDNDVSAMVIRNLVLEMGKADIVLSYLEGPQNRPKIRVWMSQWAVWFFNNLFGLKLRYFNGPFLYKTKHMRSLPLKSKGMALLPECSINFLTQGCTCKEVPMRLINRITGRSSTISWEYYKENIRWIIDLKKHLWQRRRRPQAGF